jgi:(S)-2-hydroxyglutarate dehydrogenase
VKYDVIVIGGGIVGLATAYNILQKRPATRLLLIEKEESLAAHQTGNNSGVIHSGIYYRPGSLKAVNCIGGYHKLIQFCDQEDIPYELCGKIIVATREEHLKNLNMLFERGTQNGLKGLKRLRKEELKEYEPHVNGIEGIHVPQTGIIDFKQVSEKYGEKIRELGGEIRLGCKVTGVQTRNGRVAVESTGGDFESSAMVNCAGLYSDKVARFTNGKLDVKIVPFRGEYYKIAPEKHHLVRNLIYPVPDPNFPFLGVHFTRMVGGGIEAGPNAVLAFAREGYSKGVINLGELFETLSWPGFQKVASKYWRTGMGEMYRSFSKAAFTRALQELVPEIQEKDLVPGGAGVRAQACDRNGGLLDDFLILENGNAVNVCNAPSPAATSSLAIGDTVSDLVLKKLN